MITNECLDAKIDQLTIEDIAAICSWVQTPEILHRVSGDIADCLTPDILQNWRTIALITLASPAGKPAAFCTLSGQEAPDLPKNHIEMCHLIVDPCRNYLRNGYQIVTLARSVAQKFGYEYLCGRVAHGNKYGLALAKYLTAEEVTGTAPWDIGGFRWFRMKLSQMKEAYYGC